MDQQFVEGITRVARVLFDYQTARGLVGACHELSAIGVLLLRESGFKADLCIGVVHSPHAPPPLASDGVDFDHSWIEVAGAPIDIACASPLDWSVPLAPVICGMHVDDGRPCDLEYGVAGTLDESAANVGRQTLAEYFDAFDREGEPTLWDTTVALGRVLGLALDARPLRHRHGQTRWTLRTPEHFTGATEG
jgi:hypothetical protein